jgi:hypothetical protein
VVFINYASRPIDPHFELKRISASYLAFTARSLNNFIKSFKGCLIKSVEKSFGRAKQFCIPPSFEGLMLCVLTSALDF